MAEEKTQTFLKHNITKEMCFRDVWSRMWSRFMDKKRCPEETCHLPLRRIEKKRKSVLAQKVVIIFYLFIHFFVYFFFTFSPHPHPLTLYFPLATAGYNTLFCSRLISAFQGLVDIELLHTVQGHCTV